MTYSGESLLCEQYCNKKYRPAGLFPVHVWRYNADMKPDFVKGFRILHLGRRNAYDWVGRGDGGVLWEAVRTPFGDDKCGFWYFGSVGIYNVV